jgi:hypothetical protein
MKKKLSSVFGGWRGGDADGECGEVEGDLLACARRVLDGALENAPP